MTHRHAENPDRFAGHRWVEQATAAERDAFDDYFVGRDAFRRDPDPFTGYTSARVRNFALLAIAVVALIFFAVAHFTGPR